MNIEASVISLDCNLGVCPQTQGAVTCTITGSLATWHSPSSNSSFIATVSTKQVGNLGNTGFITALMSVNSALVR